MATFMSRLFGQAAERINYVEWLQSTGTQCINTEFNPNQNTRVVIDFEIENTAAAFYFGSRNAKTSAQFSFCQTASTTVRSDFGTKQTPLTVDTVLRRVTIDKNKATCTYNGTVITNAASTFQCNYPLYLFAVNTAGTIGTYCSGKLRSCQIYDNDVLVRDMWPCYDPDGVACMYDKVEGKYFYNAGTGEFVAGVAA